MYVDKDPECVNFHTRHSRQSHLGFMATIAGNQFLQGTQSYQNNKYQCVLSSHEVDHNMNPGLIVQPQNKVDIVLALKYAKSQKSAVAIKTGGRQYNGASSTSAPNIQLDLKKTFRGPDDQNVFEKDGRTFFHTSVSWSLGAFNTYLTKHKQFVPTDSVPMSNSGATSRPVDMASWPAVLARSETMFSCSR